MATKDEDPKPHRFVDDEDGACCSLPESDPIHTLKPKSDDPPPQGPGGGPFPSGN